MARVTYPTRTYFLPVREETQWHTKNRPKKTIPQVTFMHSELRQSKKHTKRNKNLNPNGKNKTNLGYLISGLLHETSTLNITLDSH